MNTFSFKQILLSSLWFLVAMSSSAQLSQRITIQEAIDLGLKNSKALRITQAKSDVAKAKYQQQFATSIPAVSLTSQYQHLSTNVDEIKFQTGQNTFGIIGVSIHDQFLNTLGISQVIFAGMRGFNLLKASKDQMRATQYDVERDRADTKNAIITAYYNHYKLLESKKVVDENLNVAKRRLNDSKNLQAVGMALKNDVLKVELSISNLEQTATEVQSAIDVSNFNLVTMLGLPDGTHIDIADAGLFSAKSAFDTKSGFQNALNQRPELKAADMRIAASKKQLQVTKGIYSPVISAGFNYYYSKPNQRVFIEDQIRFHDTWDIGVRLSWNITNLFTTQFQTREAKANLMQSNTVKEQLEENIRMEVNANYAAYRLALDKIQLTEKTLDQAKENQSLTKNQYDNGVKNITDMLDADNLVTTTQINLLNNKIDAEIAYTKLLKAIGNN